MKNKTRGSVLAASLMTTTVSGYCYADLNWQTNSLTFQYGKEFKVDAKIVQTLTYEHASDWSWGDVYFFMDNSWFPGGGTYNDGHHAIYSEFAPRLSFGKMSGKTLKFGPITDVLLASSVEWDKNDKHDVKDQFNYLLGPGFNLAIPGFDYFQLNFYYRMPDGGRTPDGQWQITPCWSYTIPLGRSDLVIDGYFDWVVNNKGDNHRNLLFNPQVKYDVGKYLGYESKHLYAGIEYNNWSNKYGIKDTTTFNTHQNVTSLILKYYF